MPPTLTVFCKINIWKGLKCCLAQALDEIQKMACTVPATWSLLKHCEHSVTWEKKLTQEQGDTAKSHMKQPHACEHHMLCTPRYMDLWDRAECVCTQIHKGTPKESRVYPIRSCVYNSLLKQRNNSKCTNSAWPQSPQELTPPHQDWTASSSIPQSSRPWGRIHSCTASGRYLDQFMEKPRWDFKGRDVPRFTSVPGSDNHDLPILIIPFLSKNLTSTGTAALVPIWEASFHCLSPPLSWRGLCWSKEQLVTTSGCWALNPCSGRLLHTQEQVRYTNKKLNCLFHFILINS